MKGPLLGDSYPFLRNIRSPVTSKQLRPLSPRCDRVQFDEPLTDGEFKKVANFLRRYPNVALRVYGHYSSGCDLDFLKYFPFVRRLGIDVLDLHDISGIVYANPELMELDFGATRSKRFSLSFLQRFPRLRDLFLDGQCKDIDAIQTLPLLERLTLRAITLRDLKVLTPLKSLQSLTIHLGGTKDLKLLPQIGHLRYLELFRIRGLTNLRAIAQMSHLQWLFLQDLTNVTSLPSFGDLRRLRRASLMTLRQLKNLRPIADAPALQELAVGGMSQLDKNSFLPFVGHPALRRAFVGLNSVRKNNAIQSMLGLPRMQFDVDFEFV